MLERLLGEQREIKSMIVKAMDGALPAEEPGFPQGFDYPLKTTTDLLQLDELLNDSTVCRQMVSHWGK